MAWTGWSQYDAPDNLPRPAHWSKDAACREAHPDLFYPEGDSGVAHLDTAEAKRWCARCQVQDRCLADSLARGEPHGVWGGLDEKERRRLLRRQREQARAAYRQERKREEEAADVEAQSAAAPAA
ncbi:WhiB family transcriptional regulator [Streptomyces sp. NPDC102437]|uniref:WhiB family transcriptional regulator n=1 Tax=Streptomyces sp. NPDC102437 TaxID=3366175 RepID=UPI0038188385